jgi:hypothetical protein
VNSEKSGGTFLLQQTEPKRLIGALVSTTAGSDLGWILGFFSNPMPSDLPGLFAFGEDRHETVLNIDRVVAMTLVGLLQVLVAQCAYLRDPNTQWRFALDQDSGKISVGMGPGRKGGLVVKWPTGVEGITCQVIGEQMEWRIREDLAIELAGGIIRILARRAAGNEEAG